MQGQLSGGLFQDCGMTMGTKDPHKCHRLLLQMRGAFFDLILSNKQYAVYTIFAEIQAEVFFPPHLTWVGEKLLILDSSTS